MAGEGSFSGVSDKIGLNIQMSLGELGVKQSSGATGQAGKLAGTLVPRQKGMDEARRCCCTCVEGSWLLETATTLVAGWGVGACSQADQYRNGEGD